MNPYSPPGIAAQYAPASPVQPAGSSGGSGAVSELSVAHLRDTRPWVMLLAVVAMLASLLMILAGGGLALTSLAAKSGKLPAWLGLVYIPLGLFYVYPALKLWGYSTAISRLVLSRGTSDLEAALDQQRSFWKFCGIGTVVIFVLYVAAFVVGVSYAIMSGKHH